MTVAQYAGKAAAAWFFGFVPAMEVLLAIPAALALGLDPFSAAGWSIFGNLVPVLLITGLYDRLVQVPWLARWMNKLYSRRLERFMNERGAWFLLLVTPWIGVWAASVTAKVLQMQSRRVVLFSSISVIAYGVVLTLLLMMGIGLVNR